MNREITNAVQPLRWFDALPRAAYAKWKRVAQSGGWFEVYGLPNGVLAIYEPGHFQEVISFLILGSDKALLLDTGMGIGDMGALVGELTNLPLTVVNSHCHFDHIGSNWQFPGVHIFGYPAAVDRLRRGMRRDELVHHLAGDSTCVPYPDGFSPDEYTIPPSTPIPIANGHVFDLGGRRLEVIHTPGHSPDSIMLLDRAHRILFTGDTYYPATMYAHLSSSDHVDSDFTAYRNTMRRLAQTVDVEWLYASHNEPMAPGSTLRAVADAFQAITDPDTIFETDSEGLRKYSFGGFAIVTHDPPTANSVDQ